LALLLLQPPPLGALETLAKDVAAQAQAAHAEAPLGVAVTAPGHPALQQAFSTLLLSHLTGLGLSPQLLAAPDAEALARARGTRTLLRVRLTLEGTLSAAGDVLSTWENFFSGRSPPRPATPAAVVFAEVAADKAVLALARRAEAPGLLLLEEPLTSWPVRTAALACGDMDGDGRDEVAVLTEEAVEVRARDGRLLARRTLDALPRAEVPAREAFGTLAVCDGLLYAYSAQAAAGEVLALSAGALVVRAPLSRPVVACGKPPLEATFLPGQARLAPAGPGWPAPPAGPAAWGLYKRHGSQSAAWLYLLEDGTARTQRAPDAWRSYPDVGAGATVADVRGEGTLHLVASTNAAAPAEDMLRLLRRGDGAESARLSVPGRILQVAAATFEVGGPETVVLGVWRRDGGAELRLVRSMP
jgi:hypothetical protein